MATIAREIQQSSAREGLHPRKLAAESSDNAVKAAALQSLADRGDGESIPLFFDALESPEMGTRSTGYMALRRIMSLPEENEFGYTVDGPAESRAAGARKLREKHAKTLEEQKARQRELYGK